MTENTVFIKFINEQINKRKYKNYLKEAIRQYDILKYHIHQLTAPEIKMMYCQIVKKYSQKENKQTAINYSEENSWMTHQLKIFVWVAICYALQEDQHLSSLNQNGWKFLVSVFYFKPFEILQFQLLSLLKGESTSQSRKWTNSQNQLLIQIVRDQGLQNKWNEISKLFYLKSGKKYFRKPQKCREHWNNHLNPVISHEPWSFIQDLMLIEKVNKVGKKWSDISISLGGHRTEHMVKNRYKSLQNKFKAQIQLSHEKKLDLQMICKTMKLKEEQQKQMDSIQSESSRTSLVIKNDILLQPLVPANIQQLSRDQESFHQQVKLEESSIYYQQKLIQIPEQQFFAQNNKSLELISQFDGDIKKYVDSFFF